MDQIHRSALLLQALDQAKKVAFAAINCELESLRAQMALAKDMIEARMNVFFAFSLQAKIALKAVRAMDLGKLKKPVLKNALSTLFFLVRPLALQGCSAAGFSVCSKIQSKDPSASHLHAVEYLLPLVESQSWRESEREAEEQPYKDSVREAVESEYKMLRALLSAAHPAPSKKLFDSGIGNREPMAILNARILFELSRHAKSLLWKELLRKARRPQLEESEDLLQLLNGHDALVSESLRDAFPSRVLRDFLGKLASTRLVRELLKPWQISQLQARLRSLAVELLGRGLTERSSDSEGIEEFEINRGLSEPSVLLALLEDSRRKSLASHGLQFANLTWPHPAHA